MKVGQMKWAYAAGVCYALAWIAATVKWGGVGYLAGLVGFAAVVWAAAKTGGGR